MKHRLLNGVDEKELSPVIEVKLDKVKLWLVVVTWPPLQRSHYYNYIFVLIFITKFAFLLFFFLYSKEFNYFYIIYK